MANKSIERGKVIEHGVNGTIFDVRQVPKYDTDNRTGKKTMISSSLCLFIGKHNVKFGFSTVQEAGTFAIENLDKYNKKSRTFANAIQ
jgi:hypothetical protein